MRGSAFIEKKVCESCSLLPHMRRGNDNLSSGLRASYTYTEEELLYSVTLVLSDGSQATEDCSHLRPVSLPHCQAGQFRSETHIYMT